MPLEPRQILEAFCALAEGRCAFNLKNGTHLEGYLLAVEQQHIVFISGGPLASDKEQYIPIEEVDLASLFFWREEKNCYLHAKWQETLNEWVFTPT